MDKPRKKKRIDLNSVELSTILTSVGFFLLAAFALLPPIALFTFAKELRYWWLILLFAYYGFLCWILYYILFRRDMREMRMYLGTEKYYERFPKEKYRDERIRNIQSFLDKLFPDGI